MGLGCGEHVALPQRNSNYKQKAVANLRISSTKGIAHEQRGLENAHGLV